MSQKSTVTKEQATREPRRDSAVAGTSARGTRRRLAAKQKGAEIQSALPVWIRCPKSGPEHYSGITRSKLYEWASKGYIRAVSICEPGKLTGSRRFHLGSILDFIAKCEARGGE